jgi:hypothetical protein
MSRPKHPRRELEAVLKEAEAKGWRVVQGGDQQFKMYCPNPCRCIKTVRRTPSGSRYEKNLRMQLRARTCWGGGE